MNEQFIIHNSHIAGGLSGFKKMDPHMRLLSEQTYQFNPTLLKELPTDQPGIYTLGGSRQIGKTTLLKLWMVSLMKSGIAPDRIGFITGDIILDHYELLRIMQNQLDMMPGDQLTYLVIDEITYISNWARTIKFLADAGALRKVLLILTGSDLALLKHARMTFPGRRGKSDIVDFHLYPLSFYEFVSLTNVLKKTELEIIIKNPNKTKSMHIKKLYEALNEYLMHGGFLTAINDLAIHKTIKRSTLETYSEWIRGDILKRNKLERYLREILSGLVKRYGSQISYTNLTKDLTIDSPVTVTEYINELETMDALYIQQALLEDKLLGAPKKARKLHFTDPFIFHAVNQWLNPTSDPYRETIQPTIQDTELAATLIETCFISHYRRFVPTYYIKAEGEVDIAFVKDKTFWPVELKWTQQTRPKDLKQIQKYKNARIFAKIDEQREILNIQAYPIPVALLLISTGNLL